MDGLIIIIAIIISMVNFAAKQQKQNQNPNRGGMKSQRPLPKQVRNIGQPYRTVRNMEKHRNSEMKGNAEFASASTLDDNSEGIEIEDRRRTGSLDYIEQNESSEGMDGYDTKQKQRKEKKAVPKTEAVEEEPIFNLTEENLLRSIVMAEVLGPPRAMKRNIR